MIPTVHTHEKTCGPVSNMKDENHSQHRIQEHE